MSWYSSDDYSCLSSFIRGSLNDEVVDKFYTRYRTLYDNNISDAELDEYFFDECGFFSDHISIDYRTIMVNSGPHPHDCYGPWHDCYYESEEFSIDGSDFEKIESLIIDYLNLSDEDFIDEFGNI